MPNDEAIHALRRERVNQQSLVAHVYHLRETRQKDRHDAHLAPKRELQLADAGDGQDENVDVEHEADGADRDGDVGRPRRPGIPQGLDERLARGRDRPGPGRDQDRKVEEDGHEGAGVGGVPQPFEGAEDLNVHEEKSQLDEGPDDRRGPVCEESALELNGARVSPTRSVFFTDGNFLTYDGECVAREIRQLQVPHMRSIVSVRGTCNVRQEEGTASVQLKSWKNSQKTAAM